MQEIITPEIRKKKKKKQENISTFNRNDRFFLNNQTNAHAYTAGVVSLELNAILSVCVATAVQNSVLRFGNKSGRGRTDRH